MDLRIKPMSAEIVSDLRELYGSEPDGWCWCVAWEVPTWNDWGKRTAEENRELREALWKQGKYNGYVLYNGGTPIGWCKIGPTSEWPKFCDQSNVPSSDTIYAFTCFGLKPKFQGRGLMHFFIVKVMKDLQCKGVKQFVAFPRAEENRLEPGEVWTGPLSLFLKAGFRVVRKMDRRQVLVCDTAR
jgi:hypothetical protein